MNDNNDSITTGSVNKTRSAKSFWLGVMVGISTQSLLIAVAVWLGLYRYQPYLEQLRQEQRVMIANRLDETFVAMARIELTNRLDTLSHEIEKGLSSLTPEQVEKRFGLIDAAMADKLRQNHQAYTHQLDTAIARINALPEVLWTNTERQIMALLQYRGDDPHTARVAMQMAEMAFKSNDLVLAGIYTSCAAQYAPTNADILLRYSTMARTWYLKQSTDELRQQADFFIDEVTTFLRSRLAMVDLPTIPRLLDEISWFVSQQNRSVEETSDTVAQAGILQQSRILLNKTPVGTVDALREYIDDLQAALDDVDAIADTNMAHTLREKLTARIAEYQQRANILTMLHEVKRLIAETENGGRSQRMRTAYLARAESILDDLEMSAEYSAHPYTVELKAQRKRIETIAAEMDRAYNEGLLHEIQAAIEPLRFYLNVDKNFNCFDAIDRLSKAFQQASTCAARLTDTNAVKRASGQIQLLRDVLVKWQEAQQHRYNLWAISIIRDFFYTYESHLGYGTDKVLIKNKLLELFGPIDTRVLTAESMQAYNEVFHLYYAELENEQKVELTSKMAVQKKKPITEF